MADMIVIGGGVIGLMTALELAKAGYSVVLFEKQAVGHEASWASGGILSPLYPWEWPRPLQDLADWSMRRYPEFSEWLKGESGIDPECLNSGMLVLDIDEAEPANQWSARYRQPCQVVGRSDIRNQVPAIDPSVEQAIWLPGISHIRPPRLIRALRVVLQKYSCKIYEHAMVHSILVEHDRVIGVQTGRKKHAADRVVVAMGAWSPQLLDPLGIYLPVVPVRGQMIVFRTAPDFMNPMVVHRKQYLIPRKDGMILMGSTVEFVGFNANTTQEAQRMLYEKAVKLVPSLASQPVVKQWAGLRPGKPDGLPVICRHPTVEGLYLNTGHFRNGVVLALASAALMADLIERRTPMLNPAPYGL